MFSSVELNFWWYKYNSKYNAEPPLNFTLHFEILHSFSSGALLVNVLMSALTCLHPEMVCGVPGVNTAHAQEPVVGESDTEVESVTILREFLK